MCYFPPCNQAWSSGIFFIWRRPIESALLTKFSVWGRGIIKAMTDQASQNKNKQATTTKTQTKRKSKGGGNCPPTPPSRRHCLWCFYLWHYYLWRFYLWHYYLWRFYFLQYYLWHFYTEPVCGWSLRSLVQAHHTKERCINALEYIRSLTSSSKAFSSISNSPKKFMISDIDSNNNDYWNLYCALPILIYDNNNNT